MAPTYNAQKRDAEEDYLTRVKIALRGCVSDINFMDPVMRSEEHVELMNQVRNEAICISSNMPYK